MSLVEELITNKKVLFITTKNIDYIRNVQEIRLLEKIANEVEIVASDRKNYIIRILHVWSKITRKKIKESDVVFIGFEPQFVIPFVGYKFKKKKVIIDCFISVYDTLVNDRKKIKKGSFLSKFCRWMDEKTISKADCIITDTNAHAEYFISEFKGKAELFETLYLEADKEIYYPRRQNKPDELANKYAVLYFGSILPLQGVDIVLDAIKEFEEEEDIYFEIIGPIPDKYNKPLNSNIKYIEWLEQKELAEHISNADLCLAGHFCGNIDKAWRTIPGKAYIYEMMQKRMVLGDGLANHELFNEDERHTFVKMGNGSLLAKKIREEYLENFC